LPGATTSHTLSGKALATTVAILLVADYLAMMNQTLVNVVLVQVADTYKVSLSEANWLVVGVTIIAAPIIAASGALLSKMGIKRLFYVAFVSCIIGSALGFFATNFYMMLAGRLVQAISTGILFPTTTAAILDVSPEDKAGIYIASISIVSGVAMIVAPLVSGVIATYVNLNMLFVVPAALALVLIPLTAFWLDDMYDRHSIKIDVPSFVLVFVGLTMFMFGLSIIANNLALSAVCLIGGAVVIAVFCDRQGKLKTPLLDLKPFTNRVFHVGEILVVVGIVTRTSLSLLLPIYFEGVGGYTAFDAALIVAIPLAVYLVCTYYAGKAADRFGVYPMVPIALAVLALGLVATHTAALHESITLTCAAACLAFIGVGFFYAPSKAATLHNVPDDLLTSATSINSTMVQVANSIGSALFVSLVSANMIGLEDKHVAKAEAYATAVGNTLFLAVVLCLFAFIVALIFTRLVRKSPRKL
jgi:DHA2 family lincomycin resistance protein-like MFS transporter